MGDLLDKRKQEFIYKNPEIQKWNYTQIYYILQFNNIFIFI